MSAKQNAAFAALWADAQAAGRAAIAATTPTPMVVSEADGLSNRPKPGGQSWVVPAGVCGFAWVNLRPATQPFARWAKAQGIARPAYGGGYDISSTKIAAAAGAAIQSLEYNEAAARAAAKVLQAAGVKCYAQSRLD